MSAIRIDKGVPLPRIARGLNPVSEALTKTGITDSIFVTGPLISILSNSVSVVQRATGFKFTTRKVTEAGVDGIRIWRIS
jgi:hypothetical protein